ncbi:MAG: hypothetical protein L0215_05305 [Gemmataceae bacterium]|nr:hypothetical protein [Gemmataceae bacterium]
MPIELTQAQYQAVRRGEPVRLSLPEVGEDVVLLRAAAFDGLKELLEEDQERKAIAATALETAAKWAKENPF